MIEFIAKNYRGKYLTKRNDNYEWDDKIHNAHLFDANESVRILETCQDVDDIIRVPREQIDWRIQWYIKNITT